MNKGDKCVFCEEKKVISGRKTGPGLLPMADMFGVSSESGIMLEKKNLLGFDNSAGEYAMRYVEINYCPICGRNLKG